MEYRNEFLVSVLFVILFVGFLIYLKFSYVDGRIDRLENRPQIIDSLFMDISLFGELIETKKFQSGGRTTSVCCFNIVEGSVDSFYHFDRKMRIAFKVKNNIAVMVACHWYENLNYIDINHNYPGLVTMYDNSMIKIRQIPLSSFFTTYFIYEKDLRLCDYLINH